MRIVMTLWSPPKIPNAKSDAWDFDFRKGCYEAQQQCEYRGDVIT
jgi:hypothetical protein